MKQKMFFSHKPGSVGASVCGDLSHVFGQSPHFCFCCSPLPVSLSKK